MRERERGRKCEERRGRKTNKERKTKESKNIVYTIGQGFGLGKRDLPNCITFMYRSKKKITQICFHFDCLDLS